MPLIRSQDVMARGDAQRALHQKASEIAGQQFGRKVFVRGVVELSNFCRENCSYCGMRRDNRALARNRGRVEELAEMLIHRRPASLTDINLQAGEDPIAVREIALPLVELLRKHTSLGISLCLGTLEPSLYQELHEAGARFYILKFEAARSSRYAELQAPGSLAERIGHIRLLAEAGWNVTSGFISGLPAQDAEELAESCQRALALPLVGCSVSPFIPGEATPLAGALPGDADAALNCMALLRLSQPRWLIPAVSALDLAEKGSGYRRGLRAGANVVTINLTPAVLRDEYLIYKRERIIMDEERILAAISAEGLVPSSEGMIAYCAREWPQGQKSETRAVA